ncbi:hypothetical protein DFH27DRAFT_603491 [Peziza echinospora]|nr:hypothetical protein DFH27DRAFT_603491 [Peziza echinospora]
MNTQPDNWRHWARDQTKASLLDFSDEILITIANELDIKSAICLSLASSRLQNHTLSPANSLFWHKVGGFDKRLQGLKPEWGGNLPLFQPVIYSRSQFHEPGPETTSKGLVFPGRDHRHVPLPQGITRTALVASSRDTGLDGELIDYKTMLTETLKGNVGQSCQMCLRHPFARQVANPFRTQRQYYPTTPALEVPKFEEMKPCNVVLTMYYYSWNLRLCNPCAQKNVYRKSLLDKLDLKLNIDFEQLKTQEAFYLPDKKWHTDCIWLPRLKHLINKAYEEQGKALFDLVLLRAGIDYSDDLPELTEWAAQRLWFVNSYNFTTDMQDGIDHIDFP